MKTRFQQRMQDFGRAILRLEEAFSKEPISLLERDGALQRFEFTFELAWKTLQDFFISQGYDEVKGPKKVIQQAYRDGYIQNGESWLYMLGDFQLTKHTYDESISEEVHEHVAEDYVHLFRELYERLKKEL